MLLPAGPSLVELRDRSPHGLQDVRPSVSPDGHMADVEQPGKLAVRAVGGKGRPHHFLVGMGTEFCRREGISFTWNHWNGMERL